MHGSKRHAVALAVLATCLLSSTPALAATPTNDDFDNAVVVTSLPFSGTASTVDATHAADDPDCGTGGSVWYSYTASADGTLVADTQGSDFDTWLGVFTGQRGSLDTVGCDDDAAGYLTSEVLFTATAGTTYSFMVDGFQGQAGNVAFHLQTLPDPLTSVTVQVTKGTVDRHGTVTVYGTITCDQTGSAQVYLVARQGNRRFTSGGDTSVETPCGTTPTAWSASMASYTGSQFLPGRTSLDYGAVAGNVTGRASTGGQLVLNLSGTRRPRPARAHEGLPVPSCSDPGQF